uniref:Uncharacterized protein n=1 Tax=Plectus sambesii TaxID=2011161 RepID=A0A914X0I5_9BILA
MGRSGRPTKRPTGRGLARSQKQLPSAFIGRPLGASCPSAVCVRRIARLFLSAQVGHLRLNARPVPSRPVSTICGFRSTFSGPISSRGSQCHAACTLLSDQK